MHKGQNTRCCTVAGKFVFLQEWGAMDEAAQEELRSSMMVNRGDVAQGAAKLRSGKWLTAIYQCVLFTEEKSGAFHIDEVVFVFDERGTSSTCFFGIRCFGSINPSFSMA